MENIFSCKICISDYNENDNSPFSLLCSHTVCKSENRVQIICEKCSKTENFKNNCKSLPDFISQIEENVREKKIDYENLSLGKFKNELIQNSLKDIKTYIIEKLDKSFQEYYEQNKVIKDDQLSLYFYDKINKISQKINQKATIAYCLKIRMMYVI